MSGHHHHHLHQHRPHRLSLPPKTTIATTTTTTTATTSAITSRPYPIYPYSSSTPTPTPSKNRLSSFSSYNNKSNNSKSLSSLILLLFSLRSLYSLLPFLRSSPSFSLFPFSFLVSFLSFLLTFSFSLFSSSSFSKDPFHQSQKQRQPIFSFTLITQSQHRILVAKSILLAVVFLLRFQALRYCGTAATILAELCGNVAARFIAEGQKRIPGDRYRNRASKVGGFSALFVGLFLLSISWDRIECFPLSSLKFGKGGFSLFPGGNCIRVLPMLLPFLSGFLGCYERVSMNWGSIRQLGRQRVRLISLFFTTIVLFFPAVISFFMFEEEGDSVSFGNLGWPLANTVVFGVFLSENYGDEKITSSKDFQRDFLVTFFCTLVLELFYYPELSLLGLLFCGALLWISVRELDPLSSNYPELGSESSEPFSSIIMKPIRHILSERKSSKIALFLLINTAYMFVEFTVGFMSNSLGLISDACHMLFDCAALAIGLYASYISRFPANNQFNYGRGRFEVLSGYVNAVFLVLVGALIVLESFERILDPQEISTDSLLTVSIGGLVVNMVGLIFFHEEHHHAHGGAGACSHSHSNHGHHHHHSHDHVGHDHKLHGEHHKCISVSHEQSTDSHDHHCHDHDHHDHHRGDNKIGSIGHYDFQSGGHQHEHQHKHHDHGHQHDHHVHNHHDHEHQHKQHDHVHQHEHHVHNHQHEHHDHGHQHEHHDHGHQHEHHNHQHEHHDHGHQHEHHDHSQHVHHDHGSNPSTLISLQNHSHEDHMHDNSPAHEKCCSHGDHTKPFDNQAQKSNIHSHSSSGNSESQLKESSLESKLSKEPQKHHHHIDHNMEGIFLHVLADTLGSVGVVISTLLIKYKGWLVADPACSIFISVLIVSSVIPLLRNSAEILLQRVPRVHEQELRVAQDDIMRITGVHGIQNLHVWSFTNTDVVGTLNLHVSAETDKASTKAQVSQILQDAGIKDLTIQLEYVRDN